MEVYLIIGLICGAVAAAIASSKGRSAIGWFFFGFFFGLIAVIVAAIVSNLKEEQRRHAQHEAERRRLREQLRQEKMKTETFRRHATHRLDAHDEALDMDTRATGRLGAGAPAARLVGRPPSLPSQATEPLWYFALDGRQQGPVSQSKLEGMLTEGTLAPRTLVWRDGMSDWLPASDTELRVPAEPA